MPANTEIEVVGKERVELESQQSALRQQRSVLLDDREERLRRIAFRKDHRFAAQGADFGAAYIEYVA